MIFQTTVEASRTFDCTFDGNKIKLSTRAVQTMFVSSADFNSCNLAPNGKEHNSSEKVIALVTERRKKEEMEPHIKSISRD